MENSIHGKFHSFFLYVILERGRAEGGGGGAAEKYLFLLTHLTRQKVGNIQTFYNLSKLLLSYWFYQLNYKNLS